MTTCESLRVELKHDLNLVVNVMKQGLSSTTGRPQSHNWFDWVEWREKSYAKEQKL